MNEQTEIITPSRLLMQWFSSSSIGIVELDPQLNCVCCNPSAQELIWGKLDPHQNKKIPLPAYFHELLHPYIIELISHNSPSLSTHLQINRSHTNMLIRAEINLIDDQGRILIILRNSSDNARQARELKLFRNAVENTGSAVVITDKAGRIQYANKRFSEITGYSFDEIEGKRPSILRSEQTTDETYNELWSTVLNHKKWRSTLLNKRKNGTTYWSLQNISPIHDEQGNIVNFVSVSEDISQIKEHDREMEKMAYFDPLTNLGNRRNFRRSLDCHLNSPRSDGQNALLLLDLDHFKQINDTMGHEAGDALLTIIAGRLNFCTSETSSVFRLGGDEFTIIFHSCRDRKHIIERTNDVLHLLSQPAQIGTNEINITVSIGISLIGPDSQDSSDLLRKADLAMYHAKRKGRNTFAFYEEQMDYDAKRSLNMAHDLRNALEEQQLSIAYQPQIETDSGRITAMEALLRWNHPIHGHIPPSEFIPHAEETGQIIPIGHWVMREACKAAKALQDKNLPPLKVCVNLSAKQFDNPKLIAHIEDALHSSGLDAQWLELEITESMLMTDMEAGIQLLKRIKTMGISLAIDDFGTGYSSLTYLKKMPVDLLKIDRSFLQEVPNDPDNMAITSTIIAMTKQLGLQVVAEGVESREQMQFLDDHKCNMLQGYLIAKPDSFDNFCASYSQKQFFHK